MIVGLRALKITLDEKGPKAISGPETYKSLQRVKNEDCLGWSTPLSFGENKRVGADSVIVTEISKGGARYISDRIKIPDIKAAIAGK
jgi:hypothetical protein